MILDAMESVWCHCNEPRSGQSWQHRFCLGHAWWRHPMETFSALLAICAGNSPATAELPAQSPVTRSFDIFFDLSLNKRLSKQSWVWRRHRAHYDVIVMVQPNYRTFTKYLDHVPWECFTTLNEHLKCCYKCVDSVTMVTELLYDLILEIR